MFNTLNLIITSTVKQSYFYAVQENPWNSSWPTIKPITGDLNQTRTTRKTLSRSYGAPYVTLCLERGLGIFDAECRLGDIISFTSVDTEVLHKTKNRLYIPKNSSKSMAEVREIESIVVRIYQPNRKGNGYEYHKTKVSKFGYRYPWRIFRYMQWKPRLTINKMSSTTKQLLNMFLMKDKSSNMNPLNLLSKSKFLYSAKWALSNFILIVSILLSNCTSCTFRVFSNKRELR